MSSYMSYALMLLEMWKGCWEPGMCNARLRIRLFLLAPVVCMQAGMPGLPEQRATRREVFHLALYSCVVIKTSSKVPQRENETVLASSKDA